MGYKSNGMVVNRLRRYLLEAFDFNYGLAVEALCRDVRERRAGRFQLLTVVCGHQEAGLELVARFAVGLDRLEGESTPVWRAGKNGNHWDFVKRHPRAVVVFTRFSDLLCDELFEKMPRVSRDNDENWAARADELLRQLQRGNFCPSRGGEWIDYSQARLVWVPNRAKGNSSQQPTLTIKSNADLRIHRTRVLQSLFEADDIFADSHPRESRETKEVLFKHLRAGKVVWMGATPASALLKRVQQIEQEQPDGFQVRFQDDASRFMLPLSLVGSLGLHPNRLWGQFADLKDAVLERLEDNQGNELPSSVTIHAGTGKNSVGAWLGQQLGNQPIRFLIKDNRRQIRNALAQQFPKENFQFDVWQDFNDVERLAPDIALMYWQESATEVDEWLHAWRKNHPGLPVVLFTRPGSFRKHCQTLAERWALPCVLALPDKNTRGRLRWEEFRKVIRTIQYEKCLRQQFGMEIELPRFRLGRVSDNQARCSLLKPTITPLESQHSFVCGKVEERFSDVWGHDLAKERLTRSGRLVINPRLLRDYGIDPPAGIMLTGPTGCGKTLMARAFAGEMNIPFLTASASELMQENKADKFYFKQDKSAHLTLLQLLFEKARNSFPAVLFIDEIHLLLNGRHGTYGEQLLVCMDGFQKSKRPIFVIGATNDEGIEYRSNPAFWRNGRFGEVINLQLPSNGARRGIFINKFPDLFKSQGFSDEHYTLGELVGRTAGKSPADLNKLFDEAIGNADARASGPSTVTPADLHKACDFLLHNGKLDEDPTRPHDRMLTAWHEAGHALVHLLRFPERPIDYLTIEPREDSLGYLAIMRDESRHCLTKLEVEYCIQVCHAGRQAELLSPHGKAHPDEVINSGASGDINKATQYCRDAVLRFGFDDGKEGFGPVKYSNDRDIHMHLTRFAEARIRVWSINGENAARQLLSENRTTLKSIAEALLEKGCLHNGDITAIAEQNKNAA